MKIIKLLFFLSITASIFAQDSSNTKYYRQLRYNHVSPYIRIVGTHEVDKKTAQSTSHYVFTYDTHNRLIEVLNNHYHTEKKHPLASLGVYRLEIVYENRQETRKFYDQNGKRITNDRNVYKEVFSIDTNRFKYKLNFYDLNDKPMESNWKIAEYRWKKSKNLIIEKRFNLKNKPVNLSPYFEFGITGILLNKHGASKAHYNLNDKLEITNSSVGIASYQDTYDKDGNHVLYTYHDASNKLAINQWGFAIGRKIYDKNGNNIKLELLDTARKVTRSRPIYSNSTIALSKKPSQKDIDEIEKQSLGYLVALQQLKPELMKDVLNDSLNKVTIGFDRNKRMEIARETTKRQMIAFATSWNKANNQFPPKPNNQVKILDIYNRIATVKLTSDVWVEYLHLIKLNGKWKIMNLIWQYKDITRYPKQ